MWKIKEIWSSLKKTGFKQVELTSGYIIAKRKYHKNLPYYIFNNNQKGEKPLVMFIHGYTDTPLLGLTTALDLANAGFVAVLPEAKWHGFEKPANFKELFASDSFIYSMFKVFKDTIKGISELTTYLQNKHIACKTPVGISGFSMGGYISYILPLLDNRFSVAAPVSGSPYHYDVKAQEHFNINMNEKILKAMNDIPEPSQFIAKLSKISWLIQHAKDDETVSYNGSFKFVNLLQQREGNIDLEYKFYEKAGHHYEFYMKDTLVAWFCKKLL
ncbi:prolyl oligopeptidase family serine peptidase [Clostridium sp. 'deep sea']|uniref:alpha/beta hydrolase family protein n=1 Tax=Clostridium sp. 'deep sea' TaxID=2779445 RepID=UPI0018966406|nr:prolyl oligopeptidase family serine peptidase [Clostridium sp. 'deep sea']QOR36570.1 prolyl oligopeptidase family serine peptidase [Clostridium sp. 'deep sea']